jgi:hypothetical protein
LRLLQIKSTYYHHDVIIDDNSSVAHVLDMMTNVFIRGEDSKFTIAEIHKWFVKRCSLPSSFSKVDEELNLMTGGLRMGFSYYPRHHLKIGERATHTGINSVDEQYSNASGENFVV